MLLPVVLTLFVTTASAAAPNFIFRAGSCPDINSTTNFQPSLLYDQIWHLMLHTDPEQEQRHCCRCVTLRYQQDSDRPTYFKSYRLGRTTNSPGQVETWSRFYPFSPYNGKYHFQYQAANRNWEDTTMKIAFRSFGANFDYFMVYGCIERESTFADVALFMSRSSEVNEAKMNEFKTYMNTNKPPGTTYEYYTIPHNC